MRKLGRNQQAVLRCLDDTHLGDWYRGCGWVWENSSTTMRILDSLVRRGLVQERVKWGNPVYTLTEAGRTATERTA